MLSLPFSPTRFWDKNEETHIVMKTEVDQVGLWCWRLVNKDGDKGEEKVIEATGPWCVAHVGDPAIWEQHQGSWVGVEWKMMLCYVVLIRVPSEEKGKFASPSILSGIL